MKLKMAFIASLLMLAACSKGGQDPEPQKTLNVNPRSISFTSDDATPRQLTVTADNIEWTYSVSESWVSVSRNENILTVSVSENTSADDRNAIISVSATESGIAAIEVKVKQEGVAAQTDPVLSVSVTSLTFQSVNAETQEVAVTVGGGVEWDAEADNEWVKVSKSGNTLLVSVDDNDISKSRNSAISIVNTNKAVTVMPVRISVNQEALEVEGSIKVEGLTENNTVEFKHYYNEGMPERVNPSPVVVKLEPVTATFTLEVLTEDAWCDVLYVGNNEDPIVITPKSINNVPVDDRIVEVKIMHEDPSVEPFYFTIHKSAMQYRDTESSLQHNIENFEPTEVSGKIFTYSGNMFAKEYSEIEVAFYTENVTYKPELPNDNTSYSYAGQGEIIAMKLIDDKMISDVTQRTFTVGSEPIIGTALMGISEFFSNRIQLSNCFYARIDNDVTKDEEFALIISGEVTVSKSGEEYTFEWNFNTDTGHNITGKYTGQIEFEKKHTGFDFGGNGNNPGQW